MTDPRLTTNPGTASGKFAAKHFTDLLTSERNAGRVARVAGYAAEGIDFRFVVACEVDDDSWCELDAESLLHASLIADSWVDKLNARSCLVFAFPQETGKLADIYSYVKVASW